MKKQTLTQKRKVRAYLKGIFGEYVAMVYMLLKGYHLAARRFKSPFGEIDLIFCKKHYYIFVEVKHRPTFDAALNSLGHHQQQRIIKAAEFFMMKKAHNMNFHSRFDMVALNRYFVPKHLKNVMIKGLA